MQELVRRLADHAARHDLTLRPVHTPGRLLVRPDQTSRGVMPEEPRVRFRQDEFTCWEARFGPFSEMLGAERSFSSGEAVDGPPRLWLHPSFATVATALARVGERLTTDTETCPSGVIVVPWAPDAAWWPLTRHLSCVGRLRIGSRHLEESRQGAWVTVTARRPTGIFAFPRMSGTTLPLTTLVDLGRGDPGELTSDARRLAVSRSAPLPVGSLLYSPLQEAASDVREGERDAGTLYLVLRPFDGTGYPECAWLRRVTRRPGSRSTTFSLEKGAATAHGGSYASDGSSATAVPFRPVVSSVWLADEFSSQGVRERSREPSGTSRVQFDFERAELEIARRRGLISRSLLTETERSRMDAAIAELTVAEAEPPAAVADGDAGEAQTAESSTPVSGLRARDDASATDSPGDGSRQRLGSNPPSRRPRASARSVSGQPVVRGGYAGMRCAGCGEKFGPRSTSTGITPGGVGMIHNSRACLDRARRAMEAEAAADRQRRTICRQRREGSDTTADAVVCEPCEERAPAAPTGTTQLDTALVRTGSEQRRVQLRERVGEPRRLRMRACVEGRCAVTDEVPMVCLGSVGGVPCPARLHGQRCAQLTRGHAALGCFTCADCRLRKLAPGADPASATPEARQVAEQTCLLELSTGAEATGGSYSDYLRLENEFVASVGSLAGTVRPSDDGEVFKMMMNWLVSSASRALSLDSLYRVAGSVMVKTGRQDLTRLPSVKALYSDLRESHGEEAQPRTAITRRMIRAAHETVIPNLHKGEKVRARKQLEFAAEVMLGLRVGEVVSGGDYHGLLANHLTILRRAGEDGQPEGDEYVEGMLEHSKTKHQRYVCAVGLSQGASAVPLASIVREYWRSVGFRIIRPMVGGYVQEGPDYYVVRVSLVALTSSREGDIERIDLMRRLLMRSESAEARKWAEYSAARALQRLDADSLERKYVNVVGGPSDSADLGIVCAELTTAGFADGDRISITPGPLVRVTHGEKLGFSHMPLQAGSTYGSLHALYDQAFAIANAHSPDPELNLRGLASPLWGHHSARRGADTMARETRERSGATERMIDLTFGWLEAFYSRVMQIHYESPADRVAKSRVTMLV